ncbi:thymidylate kinase [Amycolatopsis thermalba]|uniref:Thymidylate kinase n=1 Tax=Amycolatopsis thermalba TaxID=944492 RepID=A0ABY4NS28_9PSEU|nr:MULTISPECIES: dTMP kinase [Amycolatopsis]UQS22866.1 thymidylate kinase [Amycolatopsis thermalba]
MLITFEGQDGAGKSALLAAVHEGLRCMGVDALVVKEFSESPYGQRLVEAVARDKFLRPAEGEPATLLTRALDEVADLYYQDERVIGPALARGQVVLKDRHQDTIFYTLVPTLVDGGAVLSDEHAMTWLRGLLSQLRYPPDLTVYVEAPLPVRLERIARRNRHLREHRANEVSDDDLAIFAARDRVIRQLLTKPDGQRVVVDNGDRVIEEGAEDVLDLVRERLT